MKAETPFNPVAKLLDANQSHRFLDTARDLGPILIQTARSITRSQTSNRFTDLLPQLIYLAIIPFTFVLSSSLA